MEKQLNEYDLNEKIVINLLIKQATVRETKNGSQYITLLLQDKSGVIHGIVWNATNEQIENYTSGKVVKIKGRKELYRDNLQLKIDEIELAIGKSAIDYVQNAPISYEHIEKEINEALLLIQDLTIARIVRFIYSKYEKQFYEYPAAKSNHHAFIGGLSFHTISMIRLAKHICQQYQNLNESLLIGGILLHDIGKVIELTGPISTEYTIQGKLLGHIILMSDEITRTCIKLNIDENLESVVLLKHMILAHHGKLEYGSPVTPQIIEAEILHHIDLIDARINMLDSELSHTQEKTYSQKIFGMENRSFYKHTMTNENS